MGRFFFKYLVIPIAIYLGILIVMSVIANQYGQIAGIGELAIAFIAAFPLLTVVWWFIVFSRWLYNRHSWETIPFIIANLAVGFAIGVIGLFFVMGASLTALNDEYTEQTTTLLGFLAVASILSGLVWFIHSLYIRFTKSTWNYDSVHMLPLEFELTSWSVFASFLSNREEKTIPSPKKQKKQKQRTQKSKTSIFRSVRQF